MMESQILDSKVELVRQAISAAENSLILARNLLKELDCKEKPSLREIPGVVGTFDGNFMVTPLGKKYQVPANYSSKTKLVFGDKLKMVEEESGIRRFKQIESVGRIKETGVLAKKDGRWVVVTSERSYSVLPASVKHFDGKEGDQFEVLLPKNDKTAFFATIDTKIGEAEKAEEKKEVKVKRAREKKEPPRKKEEPRGKAKITKKEAPKKEELQVEKKEEKEEEKIEPILEEEDLR